MTSPNKSTPQVHKIKAIFEGFRHVTGRPQATSRGKSYISQSSTDTPNAQTEQVLLAPEAANAVSESIETVIDTPPHHDRPKLNPKPSWVGPLPRSWAPSPNARAMAHKVTIHYQAPDLLPPVYITTSLSEPQWQPIEMDATKLQNGDYTFHKDFEVVEGEYQYKFRLGPGDWWACDESQPTIDDEDGNRNNVIFVASKPARSPARNKTDSVVGPIPVPAPTSGSEQPNAAPHLEGQAKPLPAQDTSSGEPTNEPSAVHVIFKGANEKHAGSDDAHHEHDEDDEHVGHDPVPLLKHETSYPGQVEDLSMETMLSSPTSSASGKSAIEDWVCPEPDPDDISLHQFPTHHAGILQEIQRAQRSLPENITAEVMVMSPSSRSASALSELTTPLLPSVQEEADSEEVLVMISDVEEDKSPGRDKQTPSRGAKHNRHHHSQAAVEDMKEEGIVNEKKLLSKRSNLADLGEILFGAVFAAVIAVVALVVYSTGVLGGHQDVKDGGAALGP